MVFPSDLRARTGAGTVTFMPGAAAQDHRVAEPGDVHCHTLDGGPPSKRTGSPSVDSAESPSTLGTLYKAFWSCKLILLRTLAAGRSSSISFSLRSYTLRGTLLLEW